MDYIVLVKAEYMMPVYSDNIVMIRSIKEIMVKVPMPNRVDLKDEAMKKAKEIALQRTSFQDFLSAYNLKASDLTTDLIYLLRN